MKNRQKIKDESPSWFSLLLRRISDFFYDISCWMNQRFQGKKKLTAKKKMRSGNFQRNVFLTCILIVPVINSVIYYLIVNFNSILMAFQSYDLSTGKYVFLTDLQGGVFGNFTRFVTDLKSDYKLSFTTRNSFMLYFIGLFISTPIQVFVSYFLYKKIPGTKFFKVVLYLPQILSSIVMTIIFRYFADQAIPQMIMEIWGVKPNLFATENAFTTIIIYNVWFGMGGGMIIFMGSMSRIPDELVEYGMLEGLSLMKEFFIITMPLIFSTLSVIWITGIAGLFTNQGNIYTFYGEYADPELYTYGYYLFVQVIGTKATYAQYPYASAAGLLFTIIVAPITLFVKYLLEKYGPEAEF